jgi:hypothetical protein
VILIIFAFVCSIALVHGNAHDDQIYEAVLAVLKDQFPKIPERAQCIVDDFRSKKIAGKLQSPDFLTNPEKLKNAIQSFVGDSNLSMCG